MDYHGIIINLSLIDKSFLQTLQVVGRKSILLDELVLYKVSVPPEKLDFTISALQSSLLVRFGPLFPAFYAHFYRGDDLIVVFKKQVFRVKTDPITWSEVIAYGASLGIPARQLDFSPCRLQDETY